MRDRSRGDPEFCYTDKPSEVIDSVMSNAELGQMKVKVEPVPQVSQSGRVASERIGKGISFRANLDHDSFAPNSSASP